MSIYVPFCPEHAWNAEPDVGGVRRCIKVLHVSCFRPWQSMTSEGPAMSLYMSLLGLSMPRCWNRMWVELGAVARVFT